MGQYIRRRLIQAFFTVLGVMVLTFLLFNIVAGDVAAIYAHQASGEEGRVHWRELHGLNKPKMFNPSAGTRFWTKEFYDTQFFHHMKDSVTFQAHSYRYKDKTLLDLIVQKAPKSLAITVPTLAAEWFLALVVACLVAYYRGTWLDNFGVFMTVLGMCVPYLAYMILGQYLMFQIAPEHAWGLGHKVNIYVPVLIATVAGLGGAVRFYRTVLLDEMNRDYVRTARAKGVPLPSVLFQHVLRNCMLQILTAVVMSIPFLIMGSLLLESFFGVHGLGDLMISSINDRDVPIISALTLLTTVLYVLGILITDVLYAVFDPRIRLT